MGSLVALDANLFIYSLEGNADFGQDAARVLKAVSNGEVRAIASELVFLEVLAGKTVSSAASENHAKSFLNGLGVVYCSISRGVLTLAAELRREHQNIKTPDAIHLASAIENHATHFVTNDKNLLKLNMKGIELISLKAAASLTTNAS